MNTTWYEILVGSKVEDGVFLNLQEVICQARDNLRFYKHWVDWGVTKPTYQPNGVPAQISQFICGKLGKNRARNSGQRREVNSNCFPEFEQPIKVRKPYYPMVW